MLSKLKKLYANKKAAMGLGDMYGVVMLFVMVGILVGIGTYVVAQVQAKLTANSTAYNASGNAITALYDFSTWFAIIVVVIAAAIIIGLVVRSFSTRAR